MNSFWLSLAPVLWLTIIAIPVGILFNAAIVFGLYSIILLGIVIYHIHTLYCLEQWLHHSDLSYATVPDRSGLWGVVFARLARFVRRHDKERLGLNTSLERLQRATSALPEGIVILGDKDQIEWCNSAAERHLGLNLEMDAGQHITRMVRQVRFVAYLDMGDFSKPFLLNQSRLRDVLLSIQIVPYGDREKLLISQDVTRFEKIEIMRRDFVANVSHELRTPLTVIGGFLETLLEENKISGEMGRKCTAADVRPGHPHASPGRGFADVVPAGERRKQPDRRTGGCRQTVAGTLPGSPVTECRASCHFSQSCQSCHVARQ